MEKYKITNIEKYAFHIDLSLAGCNGEAMRLRQISIHRNADFKIGDKIGIFTTKKEPNLNGMCSDVAIAYRVNGKYFVDFIMEPITQFGKEHFYDNISSKDARRMNRAIKRALRSRGDATSSSPVVNLKMFLGNNMYKALLSHSH